MLAKCYIALLFIGVLSTGVSAQETRSIGIYLFMLDDCKICQYYAPELEEMYKEYQSDSIDFLMIYPNFSSKPKNITRFKSKFGLTIPHQTDYYKGLTNKFLVKALPTVVVYDHNDKVIVYKGRIDDAYYSLGQKRRVIRHHELKDILSDLRDGTRADYVNMEAVGCFINFNDQLTK